MDSWNRRTTSVTRSLDYASRPRVLFAVTYEIHLTDLRVNARARVFGKRRDRSVLFGRMVVNQISIFIFAYLLCAM